MEQLTVVVGGQFGSEGKGAVTAHLAQRLGPNDLNIRVAGPNAGHTGYDAKGRKYALRQVPIGAVTSTCQLGIAAGSEIDLDVLRDEIDRLDYDGHDVSPRLWVHPSATIIADAHRIAEKQAHLVSRVGSTGKGVGAARADRIMRTAYTAADSVTMRESGLNVAWPDLPLGSKGDGKVLVEGTQGYGLGLHTRFYPQTTSSDCRAIDFLAMAGISPWDSALRTGKYGVPRGWDELRVWVVARVYPIRVAGNSGPLRGETTWQDLGLDEERTTVTQKVRRVGEWDGDLVAEAVRANGGSPVVKVALTMLDQLFPEVAGVTEIDGLSGRARDWICEREAEIGCEIGMVGTSPTTIIELGDGEWEAQ